MLGFGGALTDAAAYMINQLDGASREKFLRELYDPSELGLEVTRICVGSNWKESRTWHSSTQTAPRPWF
jgi:glucosylceramidase